MDPLARRWLTTIHLFATLALAALSFSGCGLAFPGIGVLIAGGGGGGGTDRVSANAQTQGAVISQNVAVVDHCVHAAACALDFCSPGLGATGQARVVCNGPLLAEWPDDAALISATWSAPSLQAVGNVVVEPATNYGVAAGGPIVPDPGHTVYVLRLDNEGLPATSYSLTFVFDIDLDTHPAPCVKVVQATTLEVLPIGSGPRLLLPGEQLGFDFTVIPQADLHVYCLQQTIATKSLSWSEVKRRFAAASAGRGVR
jgi:hypothetical protein